MSNDKFFTGYELRAIRGKKRTKADMLKDNRMLSNSLKDALSIESEVALDSGEIVNVPAIDLISIGKVAYWLKNPEKADLKEISSVLGEQKVEQEVTVKSADQLFGNLVIKEDETEQ